MAAEADRSAVGHAPIQPVTTWFGVVGLVLMITLVAAAFVQTRQQALLSQSVQSQADYLVLSLYQLETEYLRLREQWRLKPAPTRDDVQLRYDIFVSRVGLMHSERAQRLFDEDREYLATLRRLDGFIQRADLYLGTPARAPLSPQAAQVLFDELLSLDEPIHQALLRASHAVAREVTLRNDAVRQHNNVGIALTMCLSALMLLFAVIALRQMRLLEERRREMQAAAERLQQAQLDAEAASRAKSAFLANMSHEIRTPFHGLLGMLSLLRDTRMDARQLDYLRTASESADHLLAILDDILDLSKLESGTLTLSPRALSLRDLVREIESLMRPQAAAKGLALRVDLGDSVPPHASLDATRVRQVLFNLVSNAIKYTDAGHVTLAAAVEPAAGAGLPRLRFEVADTGIGMDDETLARLFRRFSQGGPTVGRHLGGTGLGLEISRNLARLMGGDITVRSELGRGSVFTLKLPLVAASAPAPAPTPDGVPPDAVLRVLVAEDHPINRKYLAALLERLGHAARFVENGMEAVQSIKEHPYDIVLMDVHMPVMDGIAATQAIRALPAPASTTRIVALTADVFADTRDRCVKAGMDEVLTKPVSMQDLRGLLARHGGGAQTGLAPAQAATAMLPMESPLIDRRILAEVVEVMPRAQVSALYDGFFTQALDAARRMRSSMRGADAEALRRAAHGVKGAALNLGLRALADSAAGLHDEAGQLGAAELALAVQRFEEAVEATRALCAAEGLLSQPATA